MEERNYSFGEKLASWRKRLGITQKELEKRSGIPYSAISDYEHNKTIPRRKTLEKLMKALVVERNELMQGAYDEQVQFVDIFNKTQLKYMAGEVVTKLVDSFVVPLTVLKNVPAGKPTPGELKEQAIGKIRLPHEMADTADYALRVIGMSMIEEGIHELDLILVRMQSNAQDKDIIIARKENGEYVIKRYRESGPEIWLEPSDSQSNSLKGKFKIIGIVTYVIRRLK
jgi:SOS-response transcriptional repressor LexA